MKIQHIILCNQLSEIQNISSYSNLYKFLIDSNGCNNNDYCDFEYNTFLSFCYPKYWNNNICNEQCNSLQCKFDNGECYPLCNFEECSID